MTDQSSNNLSKIGSSQSVIHEKPVLTFAETMKNRNSDLANDIGN